MRTIIAGSRKNITMADVLDAIKICPWEPTVVISGTAKGVDSFGESWAYANGIPIERYPADWNKYGKRAGYIRNEEMAKNAEALIAVWDGESRGTKHMIDIAKKYKLRCFVYNKQLLNILTF